MEYLFVDLLNFFVSHFLGARVASRRQTVPRVQLSKIYISNLRQEKNKQTKAYWNKHETCLYAYISYIRINLSPKMRLSVLNYHR